MTSPSALRQASVPLDVSEFCPATARLWPGRLAASISLHEHGASLPWAAVERELDERKGWIDAVVFSGCEPVGHHGIAEAITRVREIGYAVGLHASGAHPRRLAEVLPHVDWVSLEVADAELSTWTSLELIMAAGVDYEVTITVDPAKHSREHILATAREVIRRGAHAPVLSGRAMYEVIDYADLPDLERR